MTYWRETWLAWTLIWLLEAISINITLAESTDVRVLHTIYTYM